ncbi:MAG: pantetheine-phosphate adenylyltransferase [Actinobacteria bacterium]|nr:pantetheine-phosphate adenylyltransferase [Actinomycetota bacterium]
MTVAICPGSFDPATTGHMDIIIRASRIYEKVIVGVADNPQKRSLFSLDERVEMIKEALPESKNVDVEAFDSLLVSLAHKHKASVIIRGLRAVSDFEHEFQMAQLNRKLSPEVETIFMMASPEYAYLSSSAVREIAQYGGSVKGLVPPNIVEPLTRVFQSKEV